jgi:hypothetical protein
MVQRLARWASSTVPDRNAAHQAALPLAACGGAAPRQSMAPSPRRAFGVYGLAGIRADR